MQNIDTGENNDNFNKFENLQLTQPASLESLTCEQRKLLTDSPKADSSRKVYSDPEETQTKAKTRSRFSAAIRKLSGSARKKQKSIAKGHSSTVASESSELIVSSGAEDLADTSSGADSDKKLKKKSKSSKSIFGLKKSKVAPKPEEEGTLLNAEVPDENVGTAKHLEPIFQDNENEVIVTSEKFSPQFSRSQVQITIKSKKIETVASTQDCFNKNQSPTSSPLPSSAAPTTTTTTNTKALNEESETKTNISDNLKSNEPIDKKKNLKTKIITQTPQKSTATTATTTETSQSKSKQQQDEITITQSSKDTPPKERAPTKPSRLTVPTTPASPTTASQSVLSSGAVRKTATTTKAAIKLVTAGKSKKKNASKTTKGSSSPVNTSDNSTVTATVTSDKIQETQDLMINLQRGHRLPRPTSATTTTAAVASTTTTNTVKNSQVTATTQAADDCSTNRELSVNLINQNQTQQDQQRQPTNPTTPDCLAITNLPQTSAEIQSSLINASLPSQLPQQTQPQRQQQLQKENLQASPIDSLVQSKIFSQTDDHISLAESVKTGISLGEDNTHYDSRELIKEPITAVHFAVGSPVRPLFQKSLYEYSLQESSLELEKDFKDPDLAITEANRRRIHYISQPTLYDEFNSLELKRSHFRYQSGVSDLSLDTDENAVEDTFDDTQSMPAFGDLTMDQDMEPTIMTSANTEKREHLYKILVIGELGTGKTSFIKRYVHQFFSQNYRATIGVDFALKVLHWDPNTIVRLQLWDIAGQERFGNMTRVYYKEAVGAFIVFDVTRSGTFDCVSKWKEDLDSKVQLPDGSPIPCILLANKCDQDKQGVVTNNEKMDEYVKEHGFAGWFETSAKENINIDEAARALVNKILLNDKLISDADLADSEKFNINSTGDQNVMDGKNKCSC